ncbi:MAG: hypothetical protein MRY74_15750 [Neomegalonema sp.]|nr:hypothetical protein [Neomegalonema sp.]
MSLTSLARRSGGIAAAALILGGAVAAPAALSEEARGAWPAGAYMTLAPVAAPVSVLEQDAVVWLNAKLALRTRDEKVELRAKAQIDLEEVGAAAAKGLTRLWKREKCGDQFSTANATVEPAPSGDAARVSFDVTYSRKQCAIGHSDLFKAKARAMIDVRLSIRDKRPILVAKLLEKGFEPRVELLGGLSIGGVSEKEARGLMVAVLQTLLDREVEKANKKIATALADAPVEIGVLEAQIKKGDDGALALSVEAEAVAAADAIDEFIDAAMTRGFD